MPPTENKIEFIGYENELDISKIEVDSAIQPRIEKKLVDIKILAENIARIGLIEPIVVSEEEKNKKYKLIVGQRRLLAFIELKRDTIPAKIIKSLDPLLAQVISFGENLHRRDISFDDKCRVAEILFNSYVGDEQTKLKLLSQDLGVTSPTVMKYLQYKAVPPEVRKLVGEKKLSQQKAWQITSALLGNAGKIIEAAKQMADENKSNPEKENIIKAANELGPKASTDQILKRARELPPLKKLIIHIEEGIWEGLKEQTEKRGFERPEGLISDLLKQFIKNGENFK